MKRKTKSLLYHYRKYRYNQILNKREMTLLKEIEEETGYRLSSKTRKTINEYAKDVFGSVSYAPSLYVFTAYNQEFKEGWIPDNYFGYVVAPKVNKNLGQVANMKTMSKRIIQSDKLPDEFYIIDRTIYDRDFEIVTFESVEKRLFSISHEYFLKLDHSNQGKGVFKISKDNFDLNEILNIGDAVLQTPIIQSKFFDEIVKGNVATLRILTYKDNDNEIKFAASFLRLGRINEEIVQAKSAVNVPIIDENGTFNAFANKRSNWRRYYKHPDTGYKFAGNKIPYFKNAVNDCIDIHKKIPHVTIIAWDVSITDSGKTQIIEWNAKHPGIKYAEACLGPSFRNLGWENLHK